MSDCPPPMSDVVLPSKIDRHADENDLRNEGFLPLQTALEAEREKAEAGGASLLTSLFVSPENCCSHVVAVCFWCLLQPPVQRAQSICTTFRCGLNVWSGFFSVWTVGASTASAVRFSDLTSLEKRPMEMPDGSLTAPSLIMFSRSPAADLMLWDSVRNKLLLMSFFHILRLPLGERSGDSGDVKAEDEFEDSEPCAVNVDDRVLRTSGFLTSLTIAVS